MKIICYYYNHLGSIRVVVDTVGEIVSYDDYDAWGMILNGRSSNYGFADDKYKYTGKELDTETGYFHFGARAYDGRIGRWNVVDPLFEKYPNVSPYNYALNNPLRFIDPKGMEAVDATPDDPDDKKKKQQENEGNRKEEKGNILHIGMSGSAAYYAWGINGEVGVIINLTNGESELAFRFGESFGKGVSLGGEFTISPDQSLSDYEGANGFGMEAAKNVVEIEVGGDILGGNLMINPKNNLLPNGGGFSLGVGGGFFINLTNGTYTTSSFNMGNAIRKIAENPKSAFWKR